MTIGNANFKEIEKLEESKASWRHLLGYGASIYYLSVGVFAGIAIITSLATFGFHIELWPTYLIIGFLGMIYFINNVYDVNKEFQEEQAKEHHLHQIITELHTKLWQNKIDVLPDDAFGQDVLKTRQLKYYITQLSVLDIINDSTRRYQLILTRLNQILQQPIPTDPTQAAALRDAKIRASNVLDRLEKKIAWLIANAKDPQAENKLRALLGKAAKPLPSIEQASLLRRTGNWIWSYKKTIYYTKMTTIYFYGQYFSNCSLMSLMSWAGIYLMGIVFVGGAFGLLLDSIPSARKIHLKRIKGTKRQLQNKLRLMQFSLDCCDELNTLTQIEVALTNQQVFNLSKDPKRQFIPHSDLKYIEVERVERKSWITFWVPTWVPTWYADRAFELTLAGYSGWGAASTLYVVLPAAFAVVPLLSLCLSIVCGLSYALYREIDIRQIKRTQASLYNSLLNVISNSRFSIWQQHMNTYNIPHFIDAEGKAVDIEKYVKRTKPQYIYNHLKFDFDQLKNSLTYYNANIDHVNHMPLREAYSHCKKRLNGVFFRLKNTLSLIATNVNDEDINLKLQKLLGLAIPETPQKNWWQSVISTPGSMTRFISMHYQGFLDGATLSTSIASVYLFSTGYFKLLTLASSAMCLTIIFFGCGALYLAIKLLIAGNNEGYIDVLKAARKDVKTKGQLVDSVFEIKQAKEKINQITQQYANEYHMILQGHSFRKFKSPPQPVVVQQPGQAISAAMPTAAPQGANTLPAAIPLAVNTSPQPATVQQPAQVIPAAMPTTPPQGANSLPTAMSQAINTSPILPYNPFQAQPTPTDKSDGTPLQPLGNTLKTSSTPANIDKNMLTALRFSLNNFMSDVHNTCSPLPTAMSAFEQQPQMAPVN